MSNYFYNEPQEQKYEPLPEGEYPFTVDDVEPTYTNAKGTFILPVTIKLNDTNRTIRCWLSAGVSAKGKPFDMIAPFLKCIRRNPAIGEEPNFSSRSLIDASGLAYISEHDYTGDDPKYKGKTFPGVDDWIYDKAKVIESSKSKPETNKKPAPVNSEPMDDGDEVPF